MILGWSHHSLNAAQQDIVHLQEHPKSQTSKSCSHYSLPLHPCNDYRCCRHHVPSRSSCSFLSSWFCGLFMIAPTLSWRSCIFLLPLLYLWFPLCQVVRLPLELWGATLWRYTPDPHIPLSSSEHLEFGIGPCVSAPGFRANLWSISLVQIWRRVKTWDAQKP